MKLLFFFSLVAIAAFAFNAEALESIEGTTRCIAGPFKIPKRECHCASDYLHFVCPETEGANGLQRIEGTMRCQIGPFMMEERDCNCASDNMHFMC